MKGKKFSALKWMLGGLCAAGFLVFVVVNIVNNDDFWKASAVNIITIFIAIVISYFFVQRKSDVRKQKDILLSLINGFQQQITSEKAYDFTGQTGEEILMRKRDISNKLHILSELQDTFLIQTEVKFLGEKFDEYDKLISDHIADLDYLVKSKNELRRPLDLMNDKLVRISINLYK